MAEEVRIATLAGLRERLDAVGYRLDQVATLLGNDALVDFGAPGHQHAVLRR